jgi:hypothetical protein
LIERFLPWFDPSRERVRDDRTERIRLLSISVRKRAEQVIADYTQAEQGRRP